MLDAASLRVSGLAAQQRFSRGPETSFPSLVTVRFIEFNSVHNLSDNFLSVSKAVEAVSPFSELNFRAKPVRLMPVGFLCVEIEDGGFL